MFFSGTANAVLAQRIAKQLGAGLAQATVQRFSDGEVNVEILENVSGKHALIIQSTCPPSSDTLMELMMMADALRRAAASKIIAIVPYLGYARQDRLMSPGVPISAKVVADMLTGVGINQLLTVDLHSDRIQGFFNIPVDNLSATSIFLQDFKQRYARPGQLVVVSPDIGGVLRARVMATKLHDARVVMIVKSRTHSHQIEIMDVIGEVSGCHCLIVDDIVDSAATICLAAQTLKAKGAISVVAYCTHPVLSGFAVSRIEDSGIDEVMVSDSIPLNQLAQECHKIKVLSLDTLLAKAIQALSV